MYSILQIIIINNIREGKLISELGDEWDEYEKDEDKNPEIEKDLDELEEEYDPFSLKSKETDTEEYEEYHPFSLNRGESNEEQNEDYDPFSLANTDSTNEIDEDYDPFSLGSSENNEDQSENYDPFSLTNKDSSNEADEDYDELSLSNEENIDDQSKNYYSFSEDDSDVNRVIDEEYEPNKESQDEEKIENEGEYENIGSQSTVLVHETPEMEGERQEGLHAEGEEYSEQEEEQIENKEEVVEPDPEEYEKDQESIYDPDEIAFIRDMEQLGRDMKDFHEDSGCSEESLEEYDNTAFNAEQAYQKIKEKNKEKEIEEKEQHLEEHELQETIEKEGEYNRENLTEEEFKEKSNELPKEITDSEEFEYLWEEYDRLEQEGKNIEEIAELMHEAEESYKMLKNYEEELEEIYERQEKQDFESIDHKNEEEPEDYRKEVESVYQAEYFIDAEIKLQAEGKSPEEVIEKMQNIEDGYELEEEVEERFEQQKKERLKSVNHEDEEDDDDQREEIDRVDMIECVVEVEGEFHKQGKSQEEIDEETEEIANNFYKSELEIQQHPKPEKEVSEELGNEEAEIVEPELALEGQDQIKHTSVDINDENIETYPEVENRKTLKEVNTELGESIEDENKPETKESEEEKYEKLQQLYRQETGKKPMYRGRATKGFNQWLEQEKLKTKKLEIKEEKNQEEERWKKILKEWIEESKQELLSSELKLVLKEMLQEYEVLENLIKQCVKVNLTEIQREKLISILKRFQNKYPFHLDLYPNIYAFKAYVQDSHPWDINHIKYRFIRHLSKKYEQKKENNKFRHNIFDFLNELINKINLTTKQENILESKVIKILDYFIYRIENNEIETISTTNPKIIATSTLYTAIISEENMPKISMTQLGKIADVNPSTLGGIYRKCFSDIYPKAKFRHSIYKLGKIRNHIALLFFEMIKAYNSRIMTSDLVMYLKKSVLTGKGIPTSLTQNDIDRLYKMIINHHSTFIKYFSDVAEIVKYLIYSSIIHKKIGALFLISPFVDFLENNNVNLLQKGRFYFSVQKILNFLRKKDPMFFPDISTDRIILTEEEKVRRDLDYRRVTGKKLQLYIIKNIYNGLYYKSGELRCPECIKERFNINTGLARYKALALHHETDNKERKLKSDNLFLLFNENRFRPEVLDFLIKLVESEGACLLCRSHHRVNHYNDQFDYIINFNNLFSLPAELIHLLVKISINYFRLTKNLTPNEKGNIKKNILRKIKKRYIIESFYGIHCHTCGEFNTREHLEAFDFHHKDKVQKEKIVASSLYDTLSCSEIASLLINEKGGYMCSNCHTVIQNKLLYLSDKIFEDKKILKMIRKDFEQVNQRFTTMDRFKHPQIRNILKKTVLLNETFERYLIAIYELSKERREITISDISDFTGFSQSTIHHFFNKNSDLINQSIEINIGNAPKPTKIKMTDKGRKFVDLIMHVKSHYSSL